MNQKNKLSEHLNCDIISVENNHRVGRYDQVIICFDDGWMPNNNKSL